MKVVFQIITLLMVLFVSPSFVLKDSNEILNANDEYTIDNIFLKQDLEYGTLDEDGDDIDFVFIRTKLKEGNYAIEITDGPGDLYEIKGTDYYITFTTYYGYAGYSEEGVLEISRYGSGTFKKLED